VYPSIGLKGILPRPLLSEQPGRWTDVHSARSAIPAPRPRPDDPTAPPTGGSHPGHAAILL